MGHSHSHTMKVFFLKNAMETLALEHPLVDSLSQVILFLVFIILTSYSCQSIMGGTSVTNAQAWRWRETTAAVYNLGLQSTPSPREGSTPAGTTPCSQPQALVWPRDGEELWAPKMSCLCFAFPSSPRWYKSAMNTPCKCIRTTCECSFMPESLLNAKAVLKDYPKCI